MTSSFKDRFNRVDGPLGTNWTIVDGHASILDEAVRPIDTSGSQTPTVPTSPLNGLSAELTQVVYSNQTLDAPHCVVRGVWGHDDITPTGVSGDPHFTIMARMTKDPFLIDLAGDEKLVAYDQGYGLRVVCPLSGAAPILQIVKFTTNRRINQVDLTTPYVTDSTVLTSITLTAAHLNTSDGATATLYKGFWQDMRFRVTGGDGLVTLEAFINDRYENAPLLTAEDRQDPVWSAVGEPGFQFRSPIFDGATSPDTREGKSVMACTLFEVSTVKFIDRPRSVAPGNCQTYGKVVDRVISLVERDGDAKWSATTSGQTRRDTYLEFVLEAEADLIRKEGYYDWLVTESNLYLSDGAEIYEMPEDFGLIRQIRPGNWQGVPLTWLEAFLFRQRIGTIAQTSGKPTVYTDSPSGPNDRKRYRFFPVPAIDSVSTTDSGDPYAVVEYYRRRLRPSVMDEQLPTVPQDDMDVLIYGAAAHAALLDTDATNTQMLAAVYASKLKDLRRKNNRKTSGAFTVARPASQVFQPNVATRIPLLRATQLETLLV
jgi:hypothetical protein